MPNMKANRYYYNLEDVQASTRYYRASRARVPHLLTIIVTSDDGAAKALGTFKHRAAAIRGVLILGADAPMSA